MSLRKLLSEKVKIIMRILIKVIFSKSAEIMIDQSFGFSYITSTKNLNIIGYLALKDFIPIV